MRTSSLASPLPAASARSSSASLSGAASPAPSSSDDRRNVPVPDELASVRAEIRRLAERETELKQLLIANPDLREGASYYAEVRVVKVPRTEWKELKHFHPDLVDEFTVMLEQTRVVLMGISEDGEIVSARKMKAG